MYPSRVFGLAHFESTTVVSTYTLTEEEANMQKEKRKNEMRGDTIECEYCNELKSKANINRHRKTCKKTKANVETKNLKGSFR